MKMRFLALAALLATAIPAYAVDTSIDGNIRANCSTATASGGAATLNNKCGVVTSESLSTAAGSPYTLTLTNSAIAAADIVLVSVGNGTNATGNAYMKRVSPAAGSAVIVVGNATENSPAAFNGTIVIRYLVVKP